jgi:hypothetical protein
MRLKAAALCIGEGGLKAADPKCMPVVITTQTSRREKKEN